MGRAERVVQGPEPGTSPGGSWGWGLQVTARSQTLIREQGSHWRVLVEKEFDRIVGERLTQLLAVGEDRWGGREAGGQGKCSVAPG